MPQRDRPTHHFVKIRTTQVEVVHLAAYYDFPVEPSDLYDKVTVKGTEQMLKGLQDFEVEQFIFSSSMLVYKPSSPGVLITEASPLEPKWDYPKSKVTPEKVMQEWSSGVVVSARTAWQGYWMPAERVGDEA